MIPFRLKNLFILFIQLIAVKAVAQQEIKTTMNRYQFINGIITQSEISIPYKLYKSKSTKKRPLVIFLHGAGQRGSDNESQLKWAISDIIEQSLKLGEDPILFIPQCPEEFRWVEVNWSDSSHIQPEMPSKPMAAVLYEIEKLMQEQPIDPNRIYLTGMSMGGYGSWDLAMRKPEWFAALVPVCGGADNSKLDIVQKIPTWIFHGSNDNVVLPLRSQSAFHRLKQLNAPVIYTEFNGVDHNAWTPAYSSAELFQWLYKQHK